ncbi:hypothetical protein NN561_002230 [Cricetulus griseus]
MLPIQLRQEQPPLWLVFPKASWVHKGEDTVLCLQLAPHGYWLEGLDYRLDVPRAGSGSSWCQCRAAAGPEDAKASGGQSTMDC